MRQINEERLVPVSIFSKKIGALEVLVKYLKENLNLSYHEIAKILNRDDRTVWVTYRNAKKKRKQKLDIKKEKFFVPVSIFANRELSVLEGLVKYLKGKGLSYVKIAKLLNKNQRNIWTINARANKKEKAKKRKEKKKR